ncbi:MAG: hypothetical protein ACRELB_18685 [Polyangiaceae bacterium]
MIHGRTPRADPRARREDQHVRSHLLASRLMLIPRLLALTLLLAPGTAFAEPAARTEVLRDGLPWEASVAYFGETFVHPGVTAALAFSPLRGSRHELALSTRLGGYVYPQVQEAFFLGGEVAYRYTAPFGLTLEVAAGLAWLETFLPGDVYTVQPGGGVTEGGSGGTPQWMPDAALGIGWDLSRRWSLPLRPFFRLEAFAQYPINTHWLPHGVAELGLAYAFDLSRTQARR